MSEVQRMTVKDIAENMQLDPQSRMRAESEGIPVYLSEKSAFQLALEIKECL